MATCKAACANLPGMLHHAARQGQPHAPWMLFGVMLMRTSSEGYEKYVL